MTKGYICIFNYEMNRLHPGTFRLEYLSMSSYSIRITCTMIWKLFYWLLIHNLDFAFAIFFHSYMLYILHLLYSKLLWNHKNSLSTKVLLRIHDVATVTWFLPLLLFLATILYILWQKGASNIITEDYDFFLYKHLQKSLFWIRQVFFFY